MTVFGNYLYENPLWSIQAFCLEELLQAFIILDQKRKDQGYYVGYLSYEAGILLQAQYTPSLQTLYPLSYQSSTPLLSFTYYQTRTPYFASENSFHFAPRIIENINPEHYSQNFFMIKEYIQQGRSYQVNFTQEMILQTHAKGIDIFQQLLQAQPTPYAAYIKDDFYEIISLSPELFFKTYHSKIITQPMKGTIRRDKDNCDHELKSFLKNDIKSRSENVMIVDLLRNDLSKIAVQNSLNVKNLFKVLTYPTLHQMVSTIQACIRKEKTLKDIFMALFPCGSITGAPKVETLKIIQNLEQRQRQIYCGAIGMISKERITFNVPIRTLFRPIHEPYYRYGVGSGIVWNSCVNNELEELKLKSHFLFSYPFCLFETMRIEGKKIFLFKEHMDRILKSAIELGFETSVLQDWIQSATYFETTNLPEALTEINFTHLPYGEIPNIEYQGILLLQLNKKGEMKVLYKPLIPHQTQKIRLAEYPQTLHNDFLYHKITARKHYQSAKQDIDSNHIFDEIHYNHDGYITEGSRTNIIIHHNGRYITPPTDCGLLAGTLRQFLLNHQLCHEEKIHKTAFINVKEIYLINSVRGLITVKLG